MQTPSCQFILDDSFKCSQFYVHESDGWCAGISIALLTHLSENIQDPYQYISPEKAFIYARDYANMLMRSYNKITGRVEQGFEKIRAAIENLQKPYSGTRRSKQIDKRINYKQEYSFNTPGMALLEIKTEQDEHPRAPNMTCYFNSKYALSTNRPDHLGVCVWTPAKKIFLFDPNAGGVLYKTNFTHSKLPYAIDAGLMFLYKNYENYGGLMRAKVLGIITLTKNELPFGKV